MNLWENQMFNSIFAVLLVCATATHYTLYKPGGLYNHLPPTCGGDTLHQSIKTTIHFMPTVRNQHVSTSLHLRDKDKPFSHTRDNDDDKRGVQGRSSRVSSCLSSYHGTLVMWCIQVPELHRAEGWKPKEMLPDKCKCIKRKTAESTEV